MKYLFILLSCWCMLSAEAAVTATVSRTVVAPGETIQLRLSRDGGGDGQPDISPLRKDFDVLGSSSGSNVQIVNGHMSTQTQVTVLISPKHDGKLQIPPISWGNEQSAAVELTVGAAGSSQPANPASNDNAHIFLSTTLDQKQPYVQSAVVLTVRLYSDQSLLQASLDFHADSNVLIKQLGKDVTTTEVRNGRNFQVIERKYLLFPQRSGKLELNGPVLNAQVQDTDSNDPMDGLFSRMPFAGMMSTMRTLRLHAKAVELNVLPRPAGITGANWLPAQKVILEETWKPDVLTIHAGEPITRHLHLSALGLTGGQLPDPISLMPLPNGLKAYPDQSTIADNPQGETVLGSRDQDIALMAERAGRYELPSVKLEWWDTVHNAKHEVNLPAHTIEVLPALHDSIASPVTPRGNAEPLSQPAIDTNSIAVEQKSKVVNSPIWMWLSLTLGLLWLGTMLAWWLSSRRSKQMLPAKVVAEKTPENISAENALNECKRACDKNDAHAARRQLLAWANATYPSDIPMGLNQLASRFDDEKLLTALRQLDRACYVGDEWNGAELAKSLEGLKVQKKLSAKTQELPELYC